MIALPDILKLDVGGQPLTWLAWQDAVTLHFTGKILWEAGEDRVTLRGGFAASGDRSTVSISTIIAVNEHAASGHKAPVPPLTRDELIQRDGGRCLYCGEGLTRKTMQFEHVVPRAQGGSNTWANIVAACAHCNQVKDNRTPDQAGMPLLALPYTPNRAEWLILANRRILADQQRFLESMAPRRPGH